VEAKTGKIVGCYFPSYARVMILYHFTKSTYGLKALTDRRLKVSRLNGLNDPFELMGVDLSNPKHSSVISKFKEELSDRYGIHCLSDAWSNPLLWGHYGDSHKGLALGFEVRDEDAFAIQYTDHREALDVDEQAGRLRNPTYAINRLLSVKYSPWAYEREYRLHVTLRHCEMESGDYFSEFSEGLRLREVVLGVYCDVSVAEISSVVATNHANVKIICASLSQSEFAVIDRESHSDRNTSGTSLYD
jgi:hypothetical protein